MVKRKRKTGRIKQASKDYNNNNKKNNSNSTEGNKRQYGREESSPSTSLAQRERTIQETVPEVFDSSSESHGAVEIKNSISMQEKDMKEALSITERKQPERTEMVNTETTDNNVNTDLPVINPLTEQQGSMMRESKEDEVAKTGITIPDYKKIQNIESYRKQENLNYCPNIFTTSISLWQNYTMAWIVTYKEFARNTGRMAEYWYRFFWEPTSAKEEEYHQQ